MCKVFLNFTNSTPTRFGGGNKENLKNFAETIIFMTFWDSPQTMLRDLQIADYPFLLERKKGKALKLIHNVHYL